MRTEAHITAWALVAFMGLGIGCGDDTTGGPSVTPSETSSNNTGASNNTTGTTDGTGSTGASCPDGVCPEGMACDAGQCIDACTAQTSTCTGEEVCDPDSGLCVAPCEDDDACDDAQICDASSGLCIAEQCSEEGVRGVCDSGEICADGRCLPEQDPAIRAMFVAGLCSGCGQMTSARYKATVVVAPVEIIDQPSTSGRFRLESGTLSIIRED